MMMAAVGVWLAATLGWGFSAYTRMTVFPHRMCVLMTVICGSITAGLFIGTILK